MTRKLPPWKSKVVSIESIIPGKPYTHLEHSSEGVCCLIFFSKMCSHLTFCLQLSVKFTKTTFNEIHSSVERKLLPHENHWTLIDTKFRISCCCHSDYFKTKKINLIEVDSQLIFLCLFSESQRWKMNMFIWRGCNFLPQMDFCTGMARRPTAE